MSTVEMSIFGEKSQYFERHSSLTTRQKFQNQSDFSGKLRFIFAISNFVSEGYVYRITKDEKSVSV